MNTQDIVANVNGINQPSDSEGVDVGKKEERKVSNPNVNIILEHFDKLLDIAVEARCFLFNGNCELTDFYSSPYSSNGALPLPDELTRSLSRMSSWGEGLPKLAVTGGVTELAPGMLNINFEQLNPECDLLIASVKPCKATRRSSVFALSLNEAFNKARKSTVFETFHNGRTSTFSDTSLLCRGALKPVAKIMTDDTFLTPQTVATVPYTKASSILRRELFFVAFVRDKRTHRWKFRILSQDHCCKEFDNTLERVTRIANSVMIDEEGKIASDFLYISEAIQKNAMMKVKKELRKTSMSETYSPLTECAFVSRRSISVPPGNDQSLARQFAVLGSVTPTASLDSPPHELLQDASVGSMSHSIEIPPAWFSAGEENLLELSPNEEKCEMCKINDSNVQSLTAAVVQLVEEQREMRKMICGLSQTIEKYFSTE